MSDVKRYDAVHLRYDESNIRYGEGCEVEVVAGYDYDRLEQECERLREERGSMQRVGISAQEDRDAALKQVEGLRDILRDSRELIIRGDFDTGYCCCGGAVEKHGIGDGHSPVDEGGYYACQLIERIETALKSRPLKKNCK